jgi:hypothetical protein
MGKYLLKTDSGEVINVTIQLCVEDSIEYFRKDRMEIELEETKEMLSALRQSIRALCRELKALCPSPLATEYPATSSAIRASLKRMLSERREAMETAATLRESIA